MTDPRILEFSYRQRPAQFSAEIDALGDEAQAALRQFSAERLTAYGLAREDAAELLDRVAQGEPWKAVALEMAQAMDRFDTPPSAATRLDRLRRRAALLRAAQMMMLVDDDERRAVFAEAAAVYRQAAELAQDRQRFEVAGPGGALVGWRFAVASPIAAAIVFGGVEGWAMDFAAMGEALARRGVQAYLIDGPGQGESRFAHGQYLRSDWQVSWRAVVDHVVADAAGLPLFMIGNSMGGCLVMNYAPGDARIDGVCSNGGPLRPPPLKGDLPSKLKKFHVFCGDVPQEEAASVWAALDSGAAMARCDRPLLIVQGGRDPLVTGQEVREIVDRAGSADRTLAVFSDGDHCVYNHPHDKHDLIGDWICDRARRPPRLTVCS